MRPFRVGDADLVGCGGWIGGCVHDDVSRVGIRVVGHVCATVFSVRVPCLARGGILNRVQVVGMLIGVMILGVGRPVTSVVTGVIFAEHSGVYGLDPGPSLVHMVSPRSVRDFTSGACLAIFFLF